MQLLMKKNNDIQGAAFWREVVHAVVAEVEGKNRELKGREKR
jgi:hypothetical protein